MSIGLDVKPSRLRATALDLFLYATSAAFAFFTAIVSSFPSHKLWGEFAAMGYASAMFAVGCLMVLSSLSPAQVLRARWLIASISFLCVVVVPLAVSISLRGAKGSNFVQDEVLTTERAGADLLNGYSPYAHVVLPAGAEPRPFPCMPLTAVFGIPHALSPTNLWSDARIYVLIFSLVVITIALTRWRVLPSHRLLVFQTLLVLPVGALALNAGGIDIAVLALLLLAVSRYASKRRIVPLLSAGGAMLMKLTAWPLALLFFALMWREGASARRSVVCATMALLGIVTILTVWDGPGMFRDTFVFPLFKIPAATPWEFNGTLSGGLLVERATNTSMLIIAGAVFSLFYLIRSKTSGVTIALRTSACYLAILIGLTPAGRPGLLVYSTSLWLWSYCGGSSDSSTNKTEERDGG